MNRLGSEKSPYLKQHAHNPVNWYPWGDAAFQEARTRNLPIFLSIGYSTCHWCHVMERESFENEQVAAVINAHFVPIKLDREERPDIDAIYMEAVQALSGRGGWPMSVFLTPDLKPFYGGTYFPAEPFVSLLTQIAELWKTDPAKILSTGANLLDWMKSQERERHAGGLGDEVFQKFYQQLTGALDLEKGGKQGAPKFPPSYEVRMLLRLYRRSQNPAALALAESTLQPLCRGGIYDHLGGGFSRYSTDENWLVPHFEKMLYDQAALTNLYLEAWQVTDNPEYEAVVRETCDYVIRDLSLPNGGFYSAEDADSEGVEGTFYVWTTQELATALTPEENRAAVAAFGVTPEGNFEGKNILALQPGYTRVRRAPELRAAMQKLKALRDKRIRPHRDEKILAGWNGLMIAAMAKAGLVLNEPRYTRAAKMAADFVLHNNRGAGGELLRRWIDGEAKHEALLEDYAFLVDGLLEVFQSTQDPKYLREAGQLAKRQDEIFWDQEKGAYFLSREDASLIRRPKEFFDNVVPSGNSVSALNLLRLGALLADPTFTTRAGELFAAEPRELPAYPMAFPQLLMALDFATDRAKEIVIVPGSNGTEIAELVRDFHPNKVLVLARDESVPLAKGKTLLAGRTTYYICEHGECQLPTNDVEVALTELAAFRPLNLI